MYPPLDPYPEPLGTPMWLSQAYLKHVPPNVPPLGPYPEPLGTAMGFGQTFYPPLDPYPEPLWTPMGLSQAYLKHVPQMYSLWIFIQNLYGHPWGLGVQ